MAAVVLAGAQAAGLGSPGEIANQAVTVAEAATKIMDVARDEATKSKEFGRSENNEENIRKNFLDNTVNAIKEVTLGQYNIVICTDQAADEFIDLKGRIMPMDIVEIDVGDGRMVNFMVYVFETGRYLRRGKWEGHYWAWYGESEKFFDVDMHVHFDNAQPKKNPDEVAALGAKQEEDKGVSEDVNGEIGQENQEAEPAAEVTPEPETEAPPEAEEPPPEEEPPAEPESAPEEPPEAEPADEAEPVEDPE